MSLSIQWRGPFENTEVNALHRESFETPTSSEDECNWTEMVERHSLGWVVGRDGSRLVCFANLVWDGSTHAWIQDAMVCRADRHQGIGTEMITVIRDQARTAGCQWLHVDFEYSLEAFYFQSCGFTPTAGGLIRLG